MGILLEKMEKICRTLSFQFMSIRITIFMLGDVWNNEDISMSDIIREVCIFKPNCLQDELEIADTLLSGRTVILNLERFNFTDSQRILDFTAGVCSAIDGTVAKVSDFIFIAVSEDVWVQEITIQSQELVFNKNGSAEVLRFEEKMSGST